MAIAPLPSSDETPEELAGKLDEQDSQAKQIEELNRQRAVATGEQIGAKQQAIKKGSYFGSNQTAAAQTNERASVVSERSFRQQTRAVGQVTKKAAENAAKAAGRTAKKLATNLIAKNPYVWGVFGVLLLVVVIIVIVFALFSLGGQGGKGYPQYASTAAEQEQITLLSALSGDKIANNTITKEVVDDEKSRYQRIKQNAAKYSSSLTGQVETKVKEFSPLLDSLVATQAKAERIKIRDDLQKKMSTFEQTLPFGSWISAIALAHQGEGSLNFCKITGAGAKVACASFVSTVLWEAGVPNAIVGTTTEVWNNKALRIAVNRPAAKSADTWTQGKSSLKPGDVIWWGDGSCSKVKYSGKLFDHIGIYVGDDQAVDNSSTKEKILKRSGASRSNCLLFNGAKRYGSE